MLHAVYILSRFLIIFLQMGQYAYDCSSLVSQNISLPLLCSYGPVVNKLVLLISLLEKVLSNYRDSLVIQLNNCDTAISAVAQQAYLAVHYVTLSVIVG